MVNIFGHLIRRKAGMNIIRKALALAIVAAWAWGAAHAADAVTFQCAYTHYSDETGGPHTQRELFRLTFIINGNKAQAIGPLGAVPVVIVFNTHGGGPTFVETTESGNVYTTAITYDGESVHSRASNIFGKLTPSQWYGRCTGPT